MRVFKNTLLLVLSLQLAFSPAILTNARWSLGSTAAYADDKKLTPSQPPLAETREARDIYERISALADEIDASADGRSAPKAPDAFHLVGQTVTTGQGTISLSGIQLEVPSFGLNFDSDVKVVVEGGSLSLIGSRKGAEVVRHTIPGLDIQSFARDREMLLVLLKDGRILGIDMVYAKDHAFSAPLPLVEVANLGFQPSASTQIAFGSRGFKPPTVIAEGAVLPARVIEKGIWDAGDLMVYRESSGGRELLGAYERGTAALFLSTGMASVAYLAVSIAPNGKREELERVISVLEDPVIRAEAIAQRAKALPQDFTGSMLALNDKARDSLMERVGACRARAGAPRDCYLLQEWKDDYQKVEKSVRQELTEMRESSAKQSEARLNEIETRIQNANLTPEWQKAVREEVHGKEKATSVISKLASSEEIRLLAYITAAGGAMVAGSLYVMDGGTAPEWAVYAVNRLQEMGVVPSVLKDAAYRGTLLKSSVALMGFIPMTYAIGAAFGAPKKISAKAGVATLGIRMYAYMQKPFLSHLAWIVRQKNALPAMRLGLNPFSKVTPESAAGQKLGLTQNARLAVGMGAQDSALKKKLVEEVEGQRRRIKAYSWFLARAVVAERYGMDPATFLMAESGKLDTAEVQELHQNPEFVKEWAQVAQELRYVMTELKSERVMADLDSLPLTELANDYLEAKRLAESIAARKGKKLEELKAALKLKWKGLGPAILQSVASFGYDQYNYLKDVEPSKFVSDSVSRQYILDYYLAVMQMAGWGGRADLAQPNALAAKIDGPLYTNPAHMGDMGEQVAIYGISVPARYVQVYQKTAEVQDSSYDPIENITLEGAARPDSFGTGMWRWLKGALSLRKANYGVFFMRGMERRLRSIQAGIIMGLSTRVFLGDQALSLAIPAWLLTTASGDWAYAWPWQPVNRGNAIYGEEIEALNAEFAEAKSAVNQGLRLRDSRMLEEGYEKLSRVFEKHYKADVPQEMRNHILAAENLLALTPEARMAEAADLKLLYGPVARLSQALDTGDRSRVERAYLDLKAQYSGQEASAELEQLNARSLLEYALKNPPFRNKPNSKVESYMTLTAALLTTFWATFLSVNSYDPAHLTAGNLFEVVTRSTAMYVGLYYGQKKVINPLADRIDQIKARARQAAEVASGQFEQEKKKLEAEAPRTLEAFVDRYVESKAAEFRVTPAQIRGQLNEQSFADLKNQFEIYRDKLAKAEAEDCANALSTKAIKPYTFVEKVRVLVSGSDQPVMQRISNYLRAKFGSK